MSNQASTGCWETCEVYRRFKQEGRVSIRDLCPSCPIRDFHAIWKPLAGESVISSPIGTGYDFGCRIRCDLCDFRNMGRDCEPCFSCNEIMCRRMMMQKQIRIIEERGV